MYKVIIVDDERIVKLAIKSMIKWSELNLTLVGTASNGNSALEMVEKLRPDIIITDIKMPGMDGVKLIKSLREKDFEGQILVLSNYNDFEMVKEAMRYGAHDYVLKITAKSDDFSRIFSEMIAKIESTRGINRNIKGKDINFDITREEILKRVILAENQDFSSEVMELTKLYAVKAEDTLFSYVISGNMKQNNQISRQLPDVLQSITEEFLAKSKWFAVIEIDKNSIFIAVLYPTADINFLPEGLALRFIALIDTYFNIKTGIVYSSISSEYSQFLTYAQKCMKTSELLFYNRYIEKAISMDLKVSEEDNVLGNIYKSICDIIYQDLLKSKDEIVLESFIFIVKQASDNNVNPYRLKKFIKKVLREVERKLINNGFCSEEVFDEYANDEDTIYIAKTENMLLLNIEDLIKSARVRISMSRLNYRKEVREAIGYIEKHAKEKITLTEIAKCVNLNDTYLCKVFKADTGKSIIPFINEVKLKIAFELLSKGDIMIKEAAAAVGIDDQFYFNRLFKKIYGLTPREIKKRE